MCVSHANIEYHKQVAKAFFSSAISGKITNLELARHIIVNCLKFTFHKATKEIECSTKSCFEAVYQKIVEDLPLDARVNLKACVERGFKDLQIINENGTINRIGLECEDLIGNRRISEKRIYWKPHDNNFFSKFIEKLFGPENFTIDFPYIGPVDFCGNKMNETQVFQSLLGQGFIREAVFFKTDQKFGNYIVVRRKVGASIEKFCKQFKAEFLTAYQKEQAYYILQRIIGCL
ncbi:MAG: hypothetical protein FD145_519 [Candidatus Saganbacteria bacterium]|uniref:Uncharacterized protein n=1 Tax=Candidatus Saganbacteria bacterium TaxID=2575572 RepID=A0A833L4F0_UNCSA|nr:MAG: hypothetical protein FD145_519 [Candidatus Saganbacteria bacterium]